MSARGAGRRAWFGISRKTGLRRRRPPHEIPDRKPAKGGAERRRPKIRNPGTVRSARRVFPRAKFCCAREGGCGRITTTTAAIVMTPHPKTGAPSLPRPQNGRASWLTFSDSRGGQRPTPLLYASYQARRPYRRLARSGTQSLRDAIPAETLPASDAAPRLCGEAFPPDKSDHAFRPCGECCQYASVANSQFQYPIETGKPAIPNWKLKTGTGNTGNWQHSTSVASVRMLPMANSNCQCSSACPCLQNRLAKASRFCYAPALSHRAGSPGPTTPRRRRHARQDKQTDLHSQIIVLWKSGQFLAERLVARLRESAPLF